VEIAREFLRSSALPEDLIIGAKAFAVANRGEGALQLLDSLSKRRRKPRPLVDAGVELIDSLPPEVDQVQRAAIRDRLIRRPGPAKGSIDDG
jgi:hypothetical protein